MKYTEFPGEREAIAAVVKAGEQFGYGNMIGHLQEAWSKMLKEKWGFDEEGGARGSGRICPWCNVDSATGKKVKNKQKKASS